MEFAKFAFGQGSTVISGKVDLFINSSGLATCISAGSVTITSVYSSITATASLACSTPANNPPVVSNIVVAQPDYCHSGPGNITVSWNYSDPDGDAQTAYRVLVDDQSSFNSPEIDTGKIDSSSAAYAHLNGTSLSFGNVTYKARVYVWDAKGASSFATGNSWTTPKNAYPQIDFSPPPPTDFDKFEGVNFTVDFTDATQFFDGLPAGSGQHSWSWVFGGGGLPPASSEQNPSNIQYSTAGAKNITLAAADKWGYSCSLSQSINIRERLIPIWKEVAPR